ncbi:helix-turn-helix transcriptional regulator [Nitrospina watsonii]|uniref:HTH luxR-type domain-containing protein n=1 Tax=Nitrospina watsonii TaxID=1323948 RepID=A0ABM9HFA1_9BACT|nr:helix-turn-helix transcriptional regulator [Nitrospina watsonii]CAI2718915.1 HTH luxR-type domain-containing protein [Nitrospina watsonii]
MDGKTYTSLPETDYLKIIEIIHALYRCQDRNDMRQCIKKYLVEGMEVDYVAWGWVELQSDLTKMKATQLLDCVGLPEHEFAVVQKMVGYHSQLVEFVLNDFRTVTATDVDYSRSLLPPQVDAFFADHPEFDREKMQTGKLVTAMCFFDRPSLDVGFGLNRVFPNTRAFTLRDVRMLELLQPALVATIKRLALQEQLKTHQALTATLAESGLSLALTQQDGRLLFRNERFQQIVPVEPMSRLPEPLIALLQKQAARIHPEHPSATAAPGIETFEHGGEVYRFEATPLHPENDRDDPAWLVQLHPAADPCTALHHLLQRSGLTAREVEVAILAGDGLADGDIAQRLFISPVTLKNHLKHIYQKLDVHSRTQLVARLRPPDAEQEL